MIGTSIALGGCSNAYYVDLGELSQRRIAMADGPPEQPTRVAMRSAEEPPARTAVARVPIEPKDIRARPDDARPWPKRGTPEYEQTQLQETERENRIKQVLNSICRGC